MLRYIATSTVPTHKLANAHHATVATALQKIVDTQAGSSSRLSHAKAPKVKIKLTTPTKQNINTEAESILNY
jgi:hypothetical protein